MTFKTYDYRYTAFDFNLANYSAGIYRLGGSEYIKNAPTGDASNIVYGNAVVLRGKNSDTVAMVVYPYYSKTPQAPYYKSSTVSGWTQASWARFALKDDLPGKIYWGGTETINVTSTGQFATGTKKITIPAGTYIVMGHATIPEGINATGRIKLDINALYETQQSWYPSQYAIEVNITTFKYFSVQTDITLSVRADKLITGITTEVAAIRIN